MPTETKSNTKRNIIIGLVLILSLTGAWWQYKGQNSYAFTFAEGESVQSWNFPGAYTGNTELEKRASDEIARLKKLVGNGPETDYSYFVAVANQYDLLGDGKNEFAYLKKALAIDDAHTGLAWENAGALFARLGAPKSARDAYSRAVQAQPSPQYVTTYLEYLTNNFAEDSAAINAVYADAVVSVGEAPQLLEIRARWLEGRGRYQEAIDEWKKLKLLSPESSTAADLEIKQLQSKL